MSHIHEKIDFVVDVFIVHGDRVLLRLHEKYRKWLAVGGHIELHEDPVEAALREVKEEVGLEVELWDGNRRYNENDGQPRGHLIPPVALNRHAVSPTHEHVSLNYFARATTDAVVPEDPNDEWKWCTKEELDSMDLLPDIRFYAKLALDTLAS